MANYIVNFTDIRTSPISISEGGINSTSTDISLFGRIRREYGELLNENLLHLLENFACAEDDILTGNPSRTDAYNEILSNPTTGQFWYNTTNKILYSWDGNHWVPFRSVDDVAANWGTIGHNQQLPKPISQTTGYEFDYTECIWSVSPAIYEASFSSMGCGTDSNAVVTMEYKLSGSNTVLTGLANYLIIGIKGNSDLGMHTQPPGLPGESPTPTPTVTPTPSPSKGAIPITITPSPTNSPVPNVCGAAQFVNTNGLQSYFESNEGLIDVNYTEMTIAFAYYGDSYSPSRYENGDLCDTDEFAFAMGYYSGSGGWTIKLKNATNNQTFNLDYTSVPGLITTGRWHGVVFGINTNTGIAKLVVDGILAKQWTTGLAGIVLKDHAPWGKKAYWGVDDEKNRCNNGRVSSVWAHNVYYDPQTNYSNFFDTNNLPRNIGADGSLAVGVQPKTYFPNGHADVNEGTLNDWTEVGSVKCVSGPSAVTTVTPTPTATTTPTPTVPLGSTARLYMSPAPCDPGTPGPGGTITRHHPTCGRVSKSAYDQSVYVSIQGLSGGTPPYTVEFWNSATFELPNSDRSGLILYNPYDPNYGNDEFTKGSAWPYSTIQRTYFGGTPSSGAMPYIRTNVSPGEIVYCRIKADVAQFYNGYDYKIGMKISGWVRVTDDIGTTVLWWMPGTEPFPEAGYTGGCNAGGTNLTGSTQFPGHSGIKSYWRVEWAHHGVPGGPTACDDCSDCIN